jgi:hypothetical protein
VLVNARVGSVLARSGRKTRHNFNSQLRRYKHTMILVDFFGCRREQIVTCSWEEACDRFPCTGMTFPDANGLISLSEALTGRSVFAAELVPLSTEPLFELSDRLQAAIRQACAEDLMDAGARWAQLQPWKPLDTNPMDLAGFLLHLQSLVHGPEREGNSIFLWVDPEHAHILPRSETFSW